jgi:hypothetical protein
MSRSPFSPVTLLGLLLAVLAALAAVLAGFGTRWGLWHFRTGFANNRVAPRNDNLPNRFVLGYL